MDLSCIISSGDLELYVLGMLPADEAEKISALAELFPEVQEEISRISSAMVSISDDADVTPSPSVKETLMRTLADMKADEPHVAPVVSMKQNLPKSTQRSPWLAAASITALIFAAGMIYLFSINSQLKGRVGDMNNNLVAAQKDLGQREQELRSTQDLLAMFSNDEFRKIDLKQLPGKDSALVHLFWNEKTNEVFVGGIQLPQPPTDKQYQLWAIVDGKPVSAGLLGTGAIQKMTSFPKAQAFAITLENKGGSVSPTMEAMVVIANT